VFEEFKKRFTMELVLIISDFAIGGVLSIKCENEKWRSIAYILKLLNKTKRNYEIYNKEILVIIKCLEV